MRQGVNRLAKRDMKIGMGFMGFFIPFMIYEFIIGNTFWIWFTSLFVGLGVIVFGVAYIKRKQTVSEYVLGVNDTTKESNNDTK